MSRRTSVLWLLPLAVPVFVGGPAIHRSMSLFFLSVAILSGLHVVTGLTRAISLCHAAFVGIGAYTGALVSLRLGAWPAAALLAGAASAGAAALVLSWATRRLEEHYLAFATLAFSEIAANIFRGATPLTGGSNGLTGVPPLSVLGVPLQGPERYFWAAATVGILMFELVRVLDRATIGRALRASGDEGRRVESLGVSAAQLRVVGFTVGGAVAGLAGALAAHLDGFVGPESYGVGLSIAYLCFLVIGGLGWLPGVLIAAAFASIGPELIRGSLEWQMIIVASLALVVLHLRADFAGRGASRRRAPMALRDKLPLPARVPLSRSTP